MKSPLIFYCLLFLYSASSTAQRVRLTNDTLHKRVDVVIDGIPFTSYIYTGGDSLKKPVLFPIRSARGTIVTRGWPLEPRPGERTDHPHHVGMWLNYENVDGFDYWNNSAAIPPQDRVKKYGLIQHTGITLCKSGEAQGILTVTADWISADGQGAPTLHETTTYHFSGKGEKRFIERATTLEAVADVLFKDAKDGLFAIRVARELEQPSDKPELFTDANGRATTVPRMDTAGVTGLYKSSEGLQGDSVWSSRGRWVNLHGRIKGEEISIAIVDHPENLGYPTYWHARGYGLFAANPLGAAVFSQGKETRNFQLKAGQKITFRYRVAIISRKTTDKEINKLADQFYQTD